MAVGVRQRWMQWAFCDQITVREGRGGGHRYVLLPSLLGHRMNALVCAPLVALSICYLFSTRASASRLLWQKRCCNFTQNQHSKLQAAFSRSDDGLPWNQFKGNSTPLHSTLFSFLFSVSFKRLKFWLFSIMIKFWPDQTGRSAVWGVLFQNALVETSVSPSGSRQQNWAMQLI